MNGHTRLLHYLLVKNGGIFRESIIIEAVIPGTVYTVDMLIKSKNEEKSKYKGVVIEANGPTHYYNPDQTEMSI